MKGTKDVKKIKGLKKRIERMKADQNGSSLPARQFAKQSPSSDEIDAGSGRSVLIRSDPLNPLLIAFDLPFMSFVLFMLFLFRLLESQPCTGAVNRSHHIAGRRPT